MQTVYSGNKHLMTVFILMLLSLSMHGQPDFRLYLQVDTTKYNYQQHRINLHNQPYFFFEPGQKDQEVALNMHFKPSDSVQQVRLKASGDFNIIDSLYQLQDTIFRGRVRFHNLAQSRFPRFVFHTITSQRQYNQEVRLYPFFRPQIGELPEQLSVFEDEERTYELNVAPLHDISLSGAWQYQQPVAYKLVATGQGLGLKIRGRQSGTTRLQVPLKTKRPFLNNQGLPAYELTTLELPVRIKPSRITYLNHDAGQIFYEPGSVTSHTIELDYHPKLQLNKTYRIENREARGGRLIAELFTRKIIQNEKKKVLCTLRPYALHHDSEGYLYIKDGDEPRFFTNLSILRKPEIKEVSVLRQGKDWTQSKIVHPGENLEIKIEGKGLKKARFSFSDGKLMARKDSGRTSTHAVYYSIHVPVNIKVSKIPVSMNGKPTSYELLVKEFQRPHPLDFVTIDYGEGPTPITNEVFKQPVLYGEEILNATMEFHRQRIDDDSALYGKQFLNIEVRLLDDENKLIEIREIDDVVIMPAEHSPRYAAYKKEENSLQRIRLNDYLANKTYNLRPWSSIVIEVKHDKHQYEEKGYARKIKILRSERYSVKVQVSFPTGLFAKKFNEGGLGNLTGISTAALAEFSFYKPERVAKKYPVKAGAGFIALNALSSLDKNAENDKDIGIVLLGSFFPIYSDSKINFPLYGGFGYLFKSSTAFLLFGPGIQFNF